MSLKFHALEVGSGDAFLLENLEKNKWRCLFDAGGAKKRIVDLLKENSINKLNLAICSHNDIDHANGFLGLLDHNSGIDIDEIWLPGTWAKIIEFVVNNGIPVGEIEEYFSKYEKSVINKEIKHILQYNDDENEEIPIEVIEKNLLDIANSLYKKDCERKSITNYYRLCKTYLEKTGDNSFQISHLLTKNNRLKNQHLMLNKILEIAAKAYNKGSKIRWFEPTINCTKDFICYGFVALNST